MSKNKPNRIRPKPITPCYTEIYVIVPDKIDPNKKKVKKIPVEMYLEEQRKQEEKQQETFEGYSKEDKY